MNFCGSDVAVTQVLCWKTCFSITAVLSAVLVRDELLCPLSQGSVSWHHLIFDSMIGQYFHND